jgi:hypothetical protein
VGWPGGPAPGRCATRGEQPAIRVAAVIPRTAFPRSRRTDFHVSIRCHRTAESLTMYTSIDCFRAGLPWWCCPTPLTIVRCWGQRVRNRTDPPAYPVTRLGHTEQPLVEPVRRHAKSNSKGGQLGTNSSRFGMG